jgi:hypothetical protein
LYDALQAGCASFVQPPGDRNVIAVLVASENQPTVEFTFPSARIAPVDFVTTTPWCIGVRVVGTFSFDAGFITINGATV